MGLNRLKRGYLIQFKRYVDQLTGSSGVMRGFGERLYLRAYGHRLRRFENVITKNREFSLLHYTKHRECCCSPNKNAGNASITGEASLFVCMLNESNRGLRELSMPL